MSNYLIEAAATFMGENFVSKQLAHTKIKDEHIPGIQKHLNVLNNALSVKKARVDDERAAASIKAIRDHLDHIENEFRPKAE